MFAALLCTILFAVSMTCGHRSAKLIGGTEANFWRLTVATLMLGIWSYAMGIGMRGAAFELFCLSGVIGIGIGDVALFQSLPRLGSRLTCLLVGCLSAPFAALTEWLWLGTALSPHQILWGLLTLGGVAIALLPGEHVHRARRDLLLGSLLAATAAFFNALGGVISRRAYEVTHAAGEHLDGGSAGFQRILGGLFVGGLCLLVVKRRAFRLQAHAPHPLAVEASKRKWRGVWPWVLINGIAGQGLGVSSMQWALETTPAGIVFAIIAITPIIIIPFARFFEDECPTPRSLLGAALAVAGVIALALSP